MANRSAVDQRLESFQVMIDDNRSRGMEHLRLDELPAPTVHGMFRVPEVLREQNEDAYRPSCVSIGPLHRGSSRLQEMEVVKVVYMCKLFERSGQSAATIQKECVEAMIKLEPRVQECHASIFSPIDSVAEMMVIDGCFIIELLTWTIFDPPDPILGDFLKWSQVKHDLLLLENQIPFFILEELFRLTRVSEYRGFSLPTSVFSFFRVDVVSYFGLSTYVQLDESEKRRNKNKTPFHILQFLHIYYVPSTRARMYKHTEKPRFKYSATKLHSAGVKFYSRHNVELFDLKFITRPWFYLWRRGLFKIPKMSIGESSGSLLRNLIAFEHCCPRIDKYFTSYAVAMSILMDSAEDVKVLEKAQVIHNNLDSSEAVSELFKNITSETVVRNQFLLYKELWGEVMDFCSPWRLALANATTQMAVIAVIILNLIVLLSSVYTVLSYYHK